jgi:hypothetical protein
MALPSSGPLSLTNIQTEFGGSNPISLSEYYRGGSYVTTNNTNVPTSGVISFSNFYGAVKQFAVVISSNLATPQNLRTLVLAAGWNGSDAVLVTNNAIISSNTTATPALTINGTFPNGVVFVNNSYIVGMAGVGGAPDNVGLPGGAAILVSTAVSINNVGTIAGGGGGGGAGLVWGWSGLDRSCAGSAGASGLTQAPATANNYGFSSSNPSGGPNGSGLYTPGGASYVWGYGGRVSSPGGAGGAWGTTGDTGGGVDGAYNYAGLAGGAGGAALSGNSNVTWIAVGTRYGTVS